MPELDLDTQAALADVKRSGLIKQQNAASWSPHMEDLMKMWGEKAAGLRFIHSKSAGKWRGFSNKLTLLSIGISAVASGVSLVAASVDDPTIKNGILYGVGGVGLLSSLIQSLKKFYNAEEKAADHGAIAKQFGSYYRFMTLQLGMSREDRMPSGQLSDFALKEYERMQQDAPPIGGDEIKLFKKTFKQSSQSVPDVCEDEFVIHVYGRVEKESDIELASVHIEDTD